MNRRIALLPLLLAPLTACANLKLRHNGFLEHEDQLQAAPEAQVWGIPDEVELYEVSDLAGKYDSILIEPPVYREVPGAEHHPTRKSIGELEATYERCLRHELGKKFELVDSPGPRTARLRASIGEVDPQKVWLNWVGLVLLTPLDMGGIVGELEVVDSETGERQFAMAAKREGTVFILLESFEKYGHARHGMRKWAKFVCARMEPEDDS